MRKIIIILMSLVMFITHVDADDYSNWQEKDENMKEDAIIEYRYRFYKEEKEGEYLENFDILEEKYQYKDSDNIKYLDFSDWQDSCDVDTNIYKVETKTLHAYQKVIATRFITLNNFSKDSKINNINIYYNNKLIDYEILNCANCVTTFSNIDKNKIVKLSLNDQLDVENLELEIELEDKDTNYQITLSNDANMNKISLQKEVNSSNTNLIFDESWLNNTVYGDIFYEINEININYLVKYLGQTSMCRYQKYMIFNYNLNKIYYDDNYYTDVLGYLKDEEDYKIYYKNKIKTVPVETNTVMKNNNVTKKEDKKEENNKEDKKEENNKEETKTETKQQSKDNKKIVTNNVDDKADTKLVKTLSISNNKSIIKYLILVVIGLTIIYIVYTNKRLIKK